MLYLESYVFENIVVAFNAVFYKVFDTKKSHTICNLIWINRSQMNLNIIGCLSLINDIQEKIQIPIKYLSVK